MASTRRWIEPPAGASGNDLSTGNKEGGETDAADETSGLAGSLSGLVTVGADEPPTTSLSLASSTLPTLFSQGVAVTYSLNGTTDTLTATAGGRTVFTLVVNANGSWTFDLDDQLDHVDNGLNDENLLLRTSLNDLVGVPSIDFSSIVVATDRDGDEITLNAGSFTIAVQDDIPVQNAVPVAATVQEDGLNAAVDEPPAGASGNDLSTGNKEGGETDAADETSGLAGSLSGLVTVGADEPPTTSLSLASSTLPTLFSQGVAVTYSLNGTTDTLTATAGGRTVFTLVVNANGSWTFDLDDQLDHVDNGLNDENLLLRTSLNDLVGVPSIDFSSIVVATDRDGDEITLNAGSFTIAVQDDIPVQNAVPVAATVQEDGLNAAVDEPPAGASGNDLSTGNKEGGETDAADETSGLAGSLSGLVTVGADEPPTTSLSLASSTLPTLFSQGVAVTYSLNGTTDTLTATAGGRTVFTLVVNANGSWTFDLDDQLDHVDNGLNDENLLLRTSLNDLVGVPSIDFSSIVVATDRDGDEITLNAGSFTIAVQDDIPVQNAVPVAATVQEDGLNAAVDEPPAGASGNDLSTGNKEGGETDAADETSGLAGSLSGLVTVGADEPPTTSLSLASSTLPTLFSQGVAVTYSLNGTTDTLTATAGGRDGVHAGGECQWFVDV